MCLRGEVIRFPKRGKMCFSESEKKRYFKQIHIRDWKQKKLKSSKVLIVGMGGLGCASALYLTAAGIGTIRLCDGDRVRERDLNRQVLYSQTSIGKLKVDEAKKRLSLLNPEVGFEIIPEFLDSQNADELTKGCDMIVDGLDNNESRFILNLQSVKKGKPYVYGAAQGWEGFVGLFHPPGTACLACILPEETLGPDEIPVPGVLPGIVGVLQASEVLKFLMDIELTLLGRLLVYDSRNLTFDVVEAEKNPNCPHCAVN
jgi:adenylyltransferase/sulfurtransferase